MRSEARIRPTRGGEDKEGMIEQTEKRSKERKKNLYVLRSMIKQNVRFKYRNSTLGVFWTVLRPVLEMLVMWMVFSQLFGRNDPTYHLYLLSGTIAFGVMSEATNSSLGSIVHSAGLLKSTKLQYEIIPLSRTLSSLVNFTFSGAALLCIMIVTTFVVDTYAISWTLVFVVVWLPALVLFSYGMSLLLAALFVFFRDIQHLYGVFITLWRYLTPMFYKADSLKDSWVYPFIQINPMTQYVDFIREIAVYATVPSPSQFILIYGFAIAFYGLGAIVFKSLKRKFILYI